MRSCALCQRVYPSFTLDVSCAGNGVDQAFALRALAAVEAGRLGEAGLIRVMDD